MNHWRFLTTLLENSPPHARHIIRCPCPRSSLDYATLEALLCACSFFKDKDLVKVHLLSSLAQDGKFEPALVPACDELLASLIPGLPHSRIVDGRWLSMPLLLTQGDNARLEYILVGLLPGNGSAYCSDKFAPDSVWAANSVIEYFFTFCPGERRDLVLLPFLTADSPPITGSSLGLSLGLALHLLTTEQTWPAGIFASAGLDRRGRVLPMADVPLKCTAVETPRVVFLADSDVANSPPELPVTGLYNLAQGIEILDFITAGVELEWAADMHHYFRNPRHLLQNFSQLPLPVLHHKKCKDLLSRIGANPGEFLQAAVQGLRRCSYDIPRATLLTGLFDAGLLLDAVSSNPDTMGTFAYAWIVERLAQANHVGEVATCGCLNSLRCSLEEYVSADERFLALNHQFVAERFNRYSFRETIPEEIQELIGEEELRNSMVYRPNRNLGAMYGTLAQNCGFCGHGSLEQMFEYSKKAEAAFSKRYRQETNRFPGYHFYAFLDAGQEREASAALNRYLGFDERAKSTQWAEGLEKNLQKPGCLFKAAAALRGLVDLYPDLSYRRIDELQQIISTRIPVYVAHPWQLICFSWGRLLVLAGKPTKALFFNERMIDLCEGGGETMQVMALQAYAELHIRKQARDEHYQGAGDLLKKIATSSYLDQEHFGPLCGAQTVEDSLQLVAEQSTSFFPFTYR